MLAHRSSKCLVERQYPLQAQPILTPALPWQSLWQL